MHNNSHFHEYVYVITCVHPFLTLFEEAYTHCCVLVHMERKCIKCLLMCKDSCVKLSYH